MRDRADGWKADGFFFTEAARGGPLTWMPGGAKFEEDALGPVRHAHDAAAEFFYVVAGAIRVEAGGDEFVVGEGDLMSIPADMPHNVLGIASDEEARVFCLVAPNHAHNKWRTGGFGEPADAARASITRPFVGHPTITIAGPLSCEPLRVLSGSPQIVGGPRECESVYLALDEGLTIHLENGTRAALRRQSYFHVRADARHVLSTSGAPCRVLRFDAAFEMWAGVPLEPTTSPTPTHRDRPEVRNGRIADALFGRRDGRRGDR